MSVLMLILLLLVTVGVVMALFRMPSKARWALVLLAAVVGLPMTLLFVRYATDRDIRVIREAHEDVSRDRADNTDFAEHDGGSAWWPEAVETLHAQCYPASSEAAQALARNIARRLADSANSDDKLLNVRVEGLAMPDLSRDSILTDIAQTLRQNLAHAEVTTVPGGKTAEDGSVHVAIGVQIGKRPAALAREPDSHIHQSVIAGGSKQRKNVGLVVLNRPRDTDWDTQLDGRIVADIGCAEGQIQESVRFLDKPWVDSFDVFISKRPRRHYALARSWSLATYPQEARQQALAAASSQLASRVHSLAAQMAPGGRAPSLETIQSNLLLAMNDNQYIVDEFSQALETNRGGSVWRHAMLIEFTPTDVANAAKVAVYQARRTHTRQVSSAAAFFGLIVLTCVVYGFLNVATKGYYREALLCGTVVIVVIGGAVLLLVA